MNNKVSVIIPTFNYAHFLEECLLSVLNQNYKNIEIIVVDDGSTDDTKDVVNQYSKKINYIYQNNCGLSSARNTGIKNATGDLIQFLDSDDLLPFDSIEKRVKFLIESGANCVVCQNKTFTITNHSGEPNVDGSWKMFSNNLDIHLCFFNIAPPHSYLTKSSVINEVGLFDINLKACEDYDYWLRLLEKKYIPLFCDRGFVYYRKHSKSMSSNNINQWYHDAILHKRLYEKLFNTNRIKINNKPASSLAFLCGILITLNRLYGRDLDIYNELYEILKNTFIKISEISDAFNSYKEFETLFYLIKLSKIIKNYYKDDELIYSKYKKMLKDKELISNDDLVNKVLLKSLFSKHIKIRDKLIILRENLGS